MRFLSAMTSAAFSAACALTATAAWADDQLPDLPVRGAPAPGGMALQTPASSIASEVVFLDNLLLWIIVPISIFVTALLAWVILFHNRKANPVPAKFTHNSPLEVAWTAIPALILLVIAFFTFPALRYEQIMPEADVTIKTTGYQWYWGYEYVDHGVEFSSFMLQREELEEYGYTQDLYLLATDTAVVVPVGKDVVVQVTAADVIHSWAMPAFGVKQDGVPGRLAQLWFNVEEEGIYFGQCSELCGINHAYMPITVKAVSEEEYVAWLERQGAQFAEGSWEADVRDRLQLAAAQ
ncbi:cytochrome c oxidase subunit II [Roseibaca sp. Y0-43]|uniref:cytochrome c oxidase subunit II n=1 Tax=Roseibaca sp. Y0-43 TaxID=2816854 RepID=UPI001D0C7B19|nr:cytochrome c oxidase subunit II [Roseibaca sp. Y0-43]MCC1481830.1 cytochrome c oxidase subunit II [Roseibaca sp. Y0-43]